LKHRPAATDDQRQHAVARQKWRAWIETSQQFSNTLAAATVARQKWRAWIETTNTSFFPTGSGPSPVRNGGRGLKHRQGRDRNKDAGPSPVRNGGRGLKPANSAGAQGSGGPSPVRNGGRGLKLRDHRRGLRPLAPRRPSEMAGVD